MHIIIDYAHQEIPSLTTYKQAVLALYWLPEHPCHKELRRQMKKQLCPWGMDMCM
jgi:hypothetical protein